MRIRSHIFISVFLATVVPLVALALGASYYGENNYQREATREIISHLHGINDQIQRQLESSQNLVLGISRASAIESFIPILESVARHESHPSIHLLRRKVNRYFEGFQTILPGVFTLRILDHRGNTLVKVTQNKVSQPQYENLYGIRYVEHQVGTPDFISALNNLPQNEVSFLTLPHHTLTNDNNFALPLLDFIVPLYKGKKWLGALAVTLTGTQIDNIVNNIPRLYKEKIFITEDNPDNPNRHGLLLYDEQSGLHISQSRPTFITLQQKHTIPLLEETILNSDGVINENSNLIYYSEFYPYPNRLIGWVIATEINKDVLSAPFTNIRVGIWLFAATALLITLILTGFAVRKISQPVCNLAAQLKSFADGKHDLRANTQQSIAEVQALASSFNYMADTLIKAQDERDKAQGMILQDNKLASIGQMAAGIGHEINNPLNNILSYTKLISRNIAKNAADIETKTLQSLQHDLDALRNETLRASDIIKGILNFARQMPPHFSQVNIKEFIQKSISLVQQFAKARHITLNSDYQGDGVFEADQAQLQQVLINLLLNAIQASENDSSIDIHVECENDTLKIQIHDQGSGIAEDILDKIYDPFFSTKQEGEGSGLGLSISLGIIESHYGRLKIINNPDKGTTATLMLPLKQTN